MLEDLYTLVFSLESGRHLLVTAPAEIDSRAYTTAAGKEKLSWEKIGGGIQIPTPYIITRGERTRHKSDCSRSAGNKHLSARSLCDGG